MAAAGARVRSGRGVRRAAAAATGSSAPAASCRRRAARTGAARGRRPGRSRARGAPAPVRGPRRGPARIGSLPAVRRRTTVARQTSTGRDRDARHRDPSAARPPTLHDVGRLGQRRDADDLDAIDEPRLVARRRPARRPDRRRRRAARRPSAGCPGTGADLAAEQTAPRAGPDGRAPARPCSDPSRIADGHRQVERGAGLAQVRRGEVDRDPPRRQRVPGIADRAADAFAGLGHRRVRQADDREPGQTRRDVRLDPDDPALEAVQRGRGDDSEHGRHAIGRRSPADLSRVTRAASRRRPGSARRGGGSRPRRPACRPPGRSGAGCCPAPSRPS